MLIVFFLIWILLNGYVGFNVRFLEIVLFGLVFSGVAFFFMTRFTKWDFSFEKFFLRHIHLFIAYGAVLFWNVVTSNFHVIATILKPHERLSPTIVAVNVPIKNEILRTILANSITLTPGTISISETDTHFLVHCLQKEYMDGFERSALVRLLLKMEEK